jgi:capsid protein
MGRRNGKTRAHKRRDSTAVMDRPSRPAGMSEGWPEAEPDASPTSSLSAIQKRRHPLLSARYDAAQTTEENERHLANADGMSARAAHSPEVRRKLRIYARYEIANCPLARCVMERLADFVVGSGPRLQIKTGDRDYNREVERKFTKWCKATGWARKLWQMRYAKAMNGESFAQFFSNPPIRTDLQPVTLDMRTIEADQVAEPSLFSDHNADSDGIIFDDFGNPIAYRVLQQHPGDNVMHSMPNAADNIRAEEMVHYFDAERAGQIRGVPEVTAALPYMSLRRRYILAVLAAAETAADIAGTIETQGSPEDPDDVEPLDTIDIERRMMMTLPKGWKLSQLRAEQPTTTLEMFDRVIIREIGRCVNMPYGIAASDSSQYNFASGKLDHLPWFQTVRIEQHQIEDVVADVTFAHWFREASLIPGYLPPSPMQDRDVPPRKWFWDGQDLLDPREAGAKDTALKNGTETHGRIYARRGEDALDEWEAQAELLGLTLDQFRERVMSNIFSGQAASGEAEGESGDEQEETDDA